MRINQPGVYPSMPILDYVADPCPDPSVNTTVIRDLLNGSPAHCAMHHPRIGGTHDAGGAAADLGSAVHGVVFGGAERIVWIQADNFRTKLAQTERDEARAAGRIPLLIVQRDVVETMAANIRDMLAVIDPAMGWDFEQTLIWQEDGCWHRSRPDAINKTLPIIVDLKTTGTGEPTAWIQSVLYRSGYDLQAAHGEAGAAALGLGEKQYFFLLAENEPPYCTSFVALDQAARDYAAHARHWAVKQFAACLTSGKWDGYPRVTTFAAPSWATKTRYDKLVALENDAQNDASNDEGGTQ